ncbi:MAG: methylmalonyl Co-A mutase-associated GTPase MeaB [Candidatus Electrothrix aestuarii]|uniref:Methylmalonyl Co-A mutase-associated GTPase MeaB n=1 Tax=Candidatus Electrothrix aestuarii TaxID=3062594 RepID=A0AAU8LX76_9BACT|nr:methylmalonyl Co-A mutase-associated GTPase MeaB [Candidatus Electrothrix aestuarii]
MSAEQLLEQVHQGDPRSVARAISLVEDQEENAQQIMQALDQQRLDKVLTVGITGPPGAGKSTLTSALVQQLRQRDIRVGVIAVDPSSPLTHGALLGDRIRMMNHALDRDVVVRSMATRGRLGGLCSAAGATMRIMAASGCRVVLVETVGIGQSEMDIASLADMTVLVLAPGFGDEIQAMKAGILEVVDLLVINKADMPGASKLKFDLGREAAESDRVLETVAAENKGIAELFDRILALETGFREDGKLTQRRQRSRDKETVDRCLDLLRERLADLLHKQPPADIDPGVAAESLLERVLRIPG